MSCIPDMPGNETKSALLLDLATRYKLLFLLLLGIQDEINLKRILIKHILPGDYLK